MAACFNEAPIHESGKYLGDADEETQITGFNEAPIHESGKSLTYEGRKIMAWRASMRPRFMNRGSPLSTMPDLVMGLLQ